MAIPAVAPLKADDEPPELADAVVLNKDEPDAVMVEAKVLVADVEVATIPKNV
jgi:hypothetical protein